MKITVRIEGELEVTADEWVRLVEDAATGFTLRDSAITELLQNGKVSVVGPVNVDTSMWVGTTGHN